MTLNLEDKKSIVTKLAEVASSSLAAVAVDYRGLKVNEMTELRAKARQSGVYLRVVRNTLARRALKDTDFSCLDPILKGPMILAFSLEDAGAAARILQEYVTKYEVLSVKGIAIDGQLLQPEELGAIARLPTREQALVNLLSIIKSPLVHLAQTLSAPLAEIARVFMALGQKQQ